MDCWTVALRLSVVSFGILGCPQLLDDHFGISLAGGPDVGNVLCIEPSCVLTNSDASVDPLNNPRSPARDAGAPPPRVTPGSAPNPPDASGAPVHAGPNPPPGDDAAVVQEPSCRTLVLDDTTHDSSSNCVGIFGWNNVQRDSNPATTVALSYRNGNPCFAGTVGASGSGHWGATYDLTFANEDSWNSTSFGVTGFDLSTTGAKQLASLKVIYKDASATDFCSYIGPGDSAVPFSAVTNCSGGSSTAPNLTQMHDLILAFLPEGQPYDVDFCVQFRALP